MKAIGIILAGGNNNKMRELSQKRAIAAMPVAGSYRAIDFALSNMSNSHIQKVAVLTQYNAKSLNEHLNSSKWWNFGRKQGGLYVFTPSITADNGFWYRGTADSIWQNISFLKNSHEPYVVITSGDGVYKLDYNDVLDYHIEKKADITVVCKRLAATDDASRFGVVRTAEDGRITDFEEKPVETEERNVSTGIYVIRRRLLIELIEKCAEEERHDIVNDILIRYKNIKKIYAYQHNEYWSNVSSVRRKICGAGFHHGHNEFIHQLTQGFAAGDLGHSGDYDAHQHNQQQRNILTHVAQQAQEGLFGGLGLASVTPKLYRGHYSSPPFC